jgi:hypothetical protein
LVARRSGSGNCHLAEVVRVAQGVSRRRSPSNSCRARCRAEEGPEECEEDEGACRSRHGEAPDGARKPWPTAMRV